jgi:hypothetical protein
MKPDEAEVILAALETIYRSPIVQGRELWLSTIEDADAAAATTVVIGQWAKGRGLPRYRPDLPELMTAIRIEQRLAERDLPEPMLSPLIPTDPAIVPAWIAVWRLARSRGDDRVLAEEEEGFRANGYAWPPPQGMMPDERREQLERELGQRG